PVQEPKRAIITGGSSGIGLALGKLLSQRGWEVALLARRADLLAQHVQEMPTKSSGIACDVSDSGSVHDAVKRAQEELGGRFDLAVANAGVGLPSHAAKFNLADAEQTIRVNVLGMMYLLDAVVPSMVERRSGRFAGVASIAGLRGLPGTGAYSASKAAMQAFLEASRVELLPYNVGVSIINHGFIVTTMTEKNKFEMPFIMPVGEAATIIADGLERGDRQIEFPLPMSLLMRTMRLVPNAWYDRIMAPAARRNVDRSKVKR